MAVRIDAVSLSRNPVTVKESLIVSVSIVTHGYLGRSTNAELTSYTNGQLRLEENLFQLMHSLRNTANLLFTV